MFLIILILPVGASLLFRDIDPEHFGNPVESAYSIFRVVSVEGWFELREHLEAKATESAMVPHPARFALMARLFFVAAVFVDEMTMDNTDELEKKIDVLTWEVKALRNDLETRTIDE